MKRVAILLVALACNRAPDPLAEHRKTCEQLLEQKALKAGLSVENCAKELKSRADLNDPARRAEDVVDRIAQLVTAGKGKPAAVEPAGTKMGASEKSVGFHCGSPPVNITRNESSDVPRFSTSKAASCS